ncbi:MAG: flavodoxin family protein [Bacteroidota bacterium]
MKILVTYWSKTGNTRKVAEAIFESLSGEKVLKPFGEIESLDGFDLILIGFPVMQFGVPALARKFITTHATGKKIALFVTHAMLTGSADPHQQEMLQKELDRCQEVCAGAEVIGLFHCQGELSKEIAETLTESKIPMLKQFAAMRPKTIGHPDTQELEGARTFAKKMSLTLPDNDH